MSHLNYMWLSEHINEYNSVNLYKYVWIHPILHPPPHHHPKKNEILDPSLVTTQIIPLAIILAHRYLLLCIFHVFSQQPVDEGGTEKATDGKCKSHSYI